MDKESDYREMDLDETASNKEGQSILKPLNQPKAHASIPSVEQFPTRLMNVLKEPLLRFDIEEAEQAESTHDMSATSSKALPLTSSDIHAMNDLEVHNSPSTLNEAEGPIISPCRELARDHPTYAPAGSYPLRIPQDEVMNGLTGLANMFLAKETADYLRGPNQKPVWIRYKQYTPHDMRAAVNAVRTGMDTLVAAYKYGIPSRTLYDKVKKLGIKARYPSRNVKFPNALYFGL